MKNGTLSWVLMDRQHKLRMLGEQRCRYEAFRTFVNLDPLNRCNRLFDCDRSEKWGLLNFVVCRRGRALPGSGEVCLAAREISIFDRYTDCSSTADLSCCILSCNKTT